MTAAASRPRAPGKVRELVFWVHLASGLVAGLVIAVMSATGVAIAFEHEVLAFLDRGVARVAAPDGEKRLPLDALVAGAATQRPGFRPTLLLVPSCPTGAFELRSGREGALYVDPYSGAVSDPRSGAAHEILHTLEEWHRWLGLEGRGQAVGKLVTGVCNAALVLLSVACALLDRQLAAQARRFETEGGFTERLHRVRSAARQYSSPSAPSTFPPRLT